jgi:transcription antitermination factor NusG
LSNFPKHADQSLWSVLHTKPRAEKKVAQQLSDMGVTAYCPTVSKVSQWSDRKKTIQKPARPSMILVKDTSYNDTQLFSFNGIVGFMSHKGKRAKVSQKEVDVLSSFLDGKYSVKKNSIEIGDLIEVPVLKKQGRVEKIKGTSCWVQLANTGLSVSFSLG